MVRCVMDDVREVLLPETVMSEIRSEIADYGPETSAGVVAVGVLRVIGDFLGIHFKEEEEE